MFAAKSSGDIRGHEFLADSGCVAIEASARFPDGKASTHCFLKGVRCDSLIAGRCGERVLAREVADQALVEVTIFLEHPCLRVLAKDPVNRKRESLSSIGD